MLKNSRKDYTYGPATVQLLDQGSMKLPSRGQAFIPPAIAIKLLTTAGADLKDTEGFAGLVVPGFPGDETPSDDWGAVAVFFKPTGFVRDDDAKTWDTSKIPDGIFFLLVRGARAAIYIKNPKNIVIIGKIKVSDLFPTRNLIVHSIMGILSGRNG